MSRFTDAIRNEIGPNVASLSKAATDPSYWSLSDLDIDLYDNQVEMIDAVCDLTKPYVGILAARGSGKTFCVAIGLVKICLDNPGFRIGIFGPKMETAKRLVKEDIIGRILTRSSKVYDRIDWKNTGNSFIQFKNGSTIKALSASTTATTESEHFNFLVLDEAHKISDWVLRERIVPMASLGISKTIKIGISLYKNNFWHSCNDNGTKYYVVRKPWNECDIYWLQGSIEYEGRSYPKRIVDLMPKSVKEKLFPNDLSLQYDSVEGYSEIEWNTQYAMIWMEDINLVLSGEQHKKLASGLFDILPKGRPEMTEKYYFGLDTASGTLMPGQKDLDWTVLTILRKNGDNTKDIVAKYQWQGDVVEQMQEIKDIVHPVNGIFQCVMGLADYSNIAIGIVEMFKREGIPIAGVTFGASEPITKKNYKNAMFDQFVFELDSGRVQYPSLEKIKKNKAFKDGYEQWGMVERHRKLGINDKIFVDPSAGHDDHCFVGSTKIRLLDGTTKTIQELAENLSENTFVYSIDLENGNAIVPGKVLKAFKTGTKQTLKITLDNGESFECTPDHKLMLRDGSYVEAQNLVAGQSMMPLYTDKQRLFKILSIEISSIQDVYDLTVDKYHNFALDCGIFVHNCSADVLAVWCADQEKSYAGKVVRTMKGIPAPIAGPSNLSGLGSPMPGQPGDPNQGRFLKDRLV